MRNKEEVLDKLDELTDYLIKLDFKSPIHGEIYGQVKILEWVLYDDINARLQKINEEMSLVSMRDNDK